MTVKFKLDNRKVPNGTILLFGIRYEGMGQTNLDTTRGRETPKVFTYTMLKAGGTWYVSGGGSTPQAAGWLAVEKWLGRDNRVVEWVKVVTEMADLWPVADPAKLAEPEPAQEAAQPAERRRGSEWRTQARTPEDEALGYRND